MQIVATISRSAGNESVGEMWKETAVFEESASVLSVFEWAQTRSRNSFETINVSLSLAQVKVLIDTEPEHGY